MPTIRTPAVEAIQRRYDHAVKAAWDEYYRGLATLDETRFTVETIRRSYLELVRRECPGQYLLAD